MKLKNLSCLMLITAFFYVSPHSIAVKNNNTDTKPPKATSSRERYSFRKTTLEQRNKLRPVFKRKSKTRTLPRMDGFDFGLMYNCGPIYFNPSIEPPLCVAVHSRILSDIIKCLADNPTTVNDRDSWDETALHIAISNHAEKTVRLLLNHGADPAFKCREGNALHMAVKTENLNIITAVLQKSKLDVINETDSYGRTPLDLVLEERSYTNKPDVLETIIKELKSCGAVAARESRETQYRITISPSTDQFIATPLF